MRFKVARLTASRREKRSFAREKKKEAGVARIVLLLIIEIIECMEMVARDSFQFLIVDDDPAIANFLVTYLHQRGHTCHSLTDGFQTAAWLAHHDCDVAIIDLKMPKVDGVTLISFIREINSHLPIIVFTGLGYNDEKMNAALSAGANGYVSKNLPIEQLYCVLSRVLVNSHQRPQHQANREDPALLGAA